MKYRDCIMNRRKEIIKELIDLGIFALCMLILFNFILKINYVPTGSMTPEICAGDIAVCSPIPYWFSKPQRGDVITFEGENDKILVKRIVGMPGDVISFENCQVHINGEVYEEAYIGEDIETLGFGTFTVPEGHYFVLGDNREHSNDSRFFREPYISEERILMKKLLVFRTSKLIEFFAGGE